MSLITAKPNGWTIIGAIKTKRTAWVILATDTTEFVTAKMWDDTPNEWYWGHYFKDHDEAMADFLDRAEISVDIPAKTR